MTVRPRRKWGEARDWLESVTNIKNGHTWSWLTGHRRAA